VLQSNDMAGIRANEFEAEGAEQETSESTEECEQQPGHQQQKDSKENEKHIHHQQEKQTLEQVLKKAVNRKTMMPAWEVSESPFFNRFVKTTEKRGLTFKVHHKHHKGVAVQQMRPKGRLHAFVEGKFFKCLSAALVIMNTIFVGIEVDADTKLALDTPPQPMPDMYRTLSRVFSTCFIIELLVRIAAYRLEFLRGDDIRWNFLDTVLVATQVVEEFADGSNLSSMRVIRLARLIRTLRIIRIISFFRDLRMMVCCVANSFLSFFWSGILLLLIMYLFTVVFMQGIVAFLREEYYVSGPGSREDALVQGLHTDSDELSDVALRDAISLHFQSLARSLLSMLMSITGGVDWYEVLRPLMTISNVYGALFALYIVFTVFGVFNVLAALFVDHALQIRDRDLLIHAETKKMDCFLQDMFELFQEADTDHTYGMTKEELFKYLQNDRVSAYMAGHCLDVSDASAVFELLDTNKSGVVETHEFVLGTARLKGQARCLDVMRIFSCFEVLQEQVLTLHSDIVALRAACSQSNSVAAVGINSSPAQA